MPPRDPPILDPPIRLAVCVSGGGTTLQNLIDRIADGRLQARVVQVVASRPGIGAIPRAEQAGIPVAVYSCRSQPDAMACNRAPGKLSQFPAGLPG